MRDPKEDGHPDQIRCETRSLRFKLYHYPTAHRHRFTPLADPRWRFWISKTRPSPFGEGVKTRIKEALLRDCNLHTIVRLPNGVFAPYTGIRTNLLFFTKGPATEAVWYYEHPYPPGVKSYNKTKPIAISEFQPERDWWGDESDGFAKRVKNEQAWREPIEKIKANGYNLDLKNPHNPDTGPGDVDHLLPEYEKLLAQIALTRSALKTELQNSLTATTAGGVA
jgi:type I restriction enzyme M protein